ncbi:fibronectin type III domain-containing protein [Alcanivorax sp. JB21]|uniref:fibronectin type III domain-containing protein n=1 Tax=Alcanivorax limicola TaxID=2874102 RepID=UPI001CBCCDA6|nr:fibronectin type III domain-containing protein [Alcanivorax limicola]MBZ2189932.1 fibronectin type III domain-containing protein [Alcanivorax limicola]
MSRRHLALPAGTLAASLAATALLAACGGGSSSSDHHISVDAPEGLSATPGNAEVTVEWDPVDDADSYNLYWAPAATGLDMENPGAGDAGWQPSVTSPHTVTELENHQNVVFVVTAVAEGRESEPSDEVTALPAPPLSGYSIETNDSTLPAGDYDMLGASCGAQRIPVSGGLRVMNVDSDTRPGLHVQESWPTQVDLGGGNIHNVWAIKALNDSGSDREIRAYAICIEPPDDLETLSREITLAAGETRSENLDCAESSGRVMLGAGVSHDTGSTSPNVRINGSEPAFTRNGRWSFRLANDSAVTRTVTLHGFCALQPLGYRRGGSGGPLIDGGAYDHDTSACNSILYDENSVVLAGAHRGHGAYSASLRLEQSYPSDDGTRWSAGVFHTGDDRMPWYRAPLCAIREP